MQTDKNTVEIKTPFPTLENAMGQLKDLCIANGWRKVDFSYFHRKEVKTATYAYFPYEPKEAEAITDK